MFLRKSDYLGCVVLLCLVVCLTFLASFFLPSASTCTFMYIILYIIIHCIKGYFQYIDVFNFQHIFTFLKAIWNDYCCVGCIGFSVLV